MLVPSVLVHLTLNDCTSKTSMLAEMYKVDLPSPDSYESELHCWLMNWQKHLHENGEASLPTTPANALRHATAMFPNIRSLLSIVMYTSSHYLLSREILQCVETDKDTLAIIYGNRATQLDLPFCTSTGTFLCKSRISSTSLYGVIPGNCKCPIFLRTNQSYVTFHSFVIQHNNVTVPAHAHI